MSVVKANTFQDASGGSNAQLYGVASPPNSMGFRNRIINGDMRIDQRNAGASITFNDAVFVVDRFGSACSQSSKATAQRSTTAPAGFTNSVLITSSSAYSVTATDFFNLYQNIEGFNAADLAWGTANAQSVTLSFWVRSSLTGTFGGSVSNSGLSRSYPFTYTISAANTFEYKTITIAGDTTGTWLTDNGIGIRVYFGLGVGSTYSGTAGAWAGTRYQSATGATSVVGTNGATFYITGVQLEAGTVASAFERRAYGQELLLCQRYFETTLTVAPADSMAVVDTGGFAITDANAVTFVQYRVQKRATPTVTFYSPLTTSPAGKVRNGSTGTINSVGGTTITTSTTAFAITSGANNQHYQLGFAVSAEL